MREDAGKVAEVSAATIAAARQRYDALAQQRLDYTLDFIVADRNCRPSSPLLVEVLPMGGTAPLRCLTQQEIAEWNDCEATPAPAICQRRQSVRQLDLGGEDRARQSALTLLEVMGDYSLLLTRLAAGEKLDTEAEVTDFLTRTRQLCKDLGVDECNSLADPKSKDVADQQLAAQVNAAAAFVQLLREAAQDNAILERLRRELARSDAAAPALKFEAALAQLAARYQAVDAGLGRLIDARHVALLRAELLAEMCAPSSSDCDSKVQEAWMARPAAYRKQKFRSLYDAQRELDAAQAKRDPLALAFGKLARLQASLRDAVVNQNYTPEQRKRIADRNLAELKALFNATRGLVDAFGWL